MSWLDVTLMVLCIISLVVILLWVAPSGSARNFNMGLITNRPSYSEAARPRYDANMSVVETVPYLRSGQPFQFTQQEVQDARNPTDEQFMKTMTLFEVAGKPMWPKTRPDRHVSDGRVDESAIGKGTKGGAKAAKAAKAFRWWDDTSVGAGHGKEAVDIHPDASVADMRSFAEMPLEYDNLGAVLSEQLAPQYEGGAMTRDANSGQLVWAQHNGPQAGPWGAKWNQANPAQPVYPLDDERARERQGPMQMPSGGLLEPYSDGNHYSKPWQTDFSMADGKPFDWSKKQIGPDGKVWTGIAYRPVEINPHLELLPANHPLKLQSQHWFAANTKCRLPPTEARKNLEKTLIGDVLRYRQIPWSFGGA